METIYINYGLMMAALFTMLAAVLVPRSGKAKPSEQEKNEIEAEGFLNPYATPLNYIIIFVIFVGVGAYMTLIKEKTFWGLDANSKPVLAVILLAGFALAAILIRLANNKRPTTNEIPVKNNSQKDTRKEVMDFIIAQQKNLRGARLKLTAITLLVAAGVALAQYQDKYLALLLFLAALPFGAFYSLIRPKETGRLSGYITLAIVFLAGGL